VLICSAIERGEKRREESAQKSLNWNKCREDPYEAKQCLNWMVESNEGDYWTPLICAGTEGRCRDASSLGGASSQSNTPTIMTKAILANL
jgi:hypothetical protein